LIDPIGEAERAQPKARQWTRQSELTGERQMIAEPCPDGQQPCVIQQKQEGVSALRLKAISGNLTTKQPRPDASSTLCHQTVVC
jgi:hypothetical protein